MQTDTDYIREKQYKEKQKFKVRDLAKGFSQEPNLTT